jgi:hypothetical protein
MRMVHALVATAAVALGTSALLAPAPADAQCSVFDRHPCNPTVCSVFRRGPCFPEFDAPIGQDLRLTIESTPAKTTGQAPPRGDDAENKDGEQKDAEQKDAEHKVDTIRALFDALRACWVPPGVDEVRAGMQMSVRFSFARTGEIIGTPRLTYVTPDSSGEQRDTYRHAIDAALERCTPMPFSKGMGGAVAGRPIAIRFVDNRERPQ